VLTLQLSCRWSDRAERAMVESFGAEYVSLHVREGNAAAIHLYRHTLKYLYVHVERVQGRR
jgi:ribosomal protein S18 acetylase RimI-like enzyme